MQATAEQANTTGEAKKKPTVRVRLRGLMSRGKASLCRLVYSLARIAGQKKESHDQGKFPMPVRLRKFKHGSKPRLDKTHFWLYKHLTKTAFASMFFVWL